MDKLTRREREVVRLLASGRSQVQIAQTLCISRRTVYAHVTKARGKVGAGSAFELAVRVASATNKANEGA